MQINLLQQRFDPGRTHDPSADVANSFDLLSVRRQDMPPGSSQDFLIRLPAQLQFLIRR
jgi:hypothetical protein